MTNIPNRQILLASRPVNGETLADFDKGNFSLVERDINIPRDGEVLVRNLLFSVDPFQRTLMGNTPSETTVLQIGDVIRGATVGIVEESRSQKFGIGDHVVGWLGWQERAIANDVGLRKLDPEAVPPSTALGVLGHTGLTAWLGSAKLMEPKPGGTFVITNAAGSVGSLAVQIAKLRGYRVVGIAGGPEKVTFVRELGIDVALDYKSTSFEADLAEAAPNGIDRLFDSVGASLFEKLMAHFARNSVVITIGQMGQYGAATEPQSDYLPALLNLILYRNVMVKGLQLTDHFDSYPEFLAEITPLVANGTIKYREEFVDGFERLPESLRRLFNGSNGGKLIVRA